MVQPTTTNNQPHTITFHSPSAACVWLAILSTHHPTFADRHINNAIRVDKNHDMIAHP
ncbi:unnamed protein product [Ceratitis capitata]|uniref:(Mediterranean fruit fly) hypothetical protein n=1 Tax=Ceratitis capitata TaxID=7213 RepID=A0A811VLQ0_CERCA|nr:unnamed protein product [Ceratitis capitata]